MGRRGKMEGWWLEDSGGEPLRLAKDFWGVGRGLQPAAEAVMLIPCWQAEEKCEGLCAEEAVSHCEVVCVL